MLKKNVKISDYLNNISQGIKNLKQNDLNKFALLIKNAISKRKNIFVCGNGGSASIANHYLADYNKILKVKLKNKFPKFISLNNSIEQITAISNDISFKKIFTYQLENYAQKNDVLIVMSCSGKSPNILDVANFAKKKNINLVSLTGFNNNFIKKKSLINLHIGVNNYGICEDIFQIIMHYTITNILNKS